MGTIDNEPVRVPEDPEDIKTWERYLLGEMTQEEVEDFETRYTSNAALLTLRETAEKKLIEAYVDEKTAGRDTSRFEKFLAIPGMTTRATIARARRTHAQRVRETSRVETIETPELMALFRRYHLGDCSTEERETIEQTSFGNDEYFGLLTLAADNLIDEYLDGKLVEGSEDRRKFDKHFKIIPGNAEKIEFAKKMRGDQNT